MLKLIGSIFILVACTGIGFSKSYEIQKHLNTLEELKKIFYMLKSEIQYTRAPFAEVFEKIGYKTCEPFQTWLFELCKCINGKIGGTFWEMWCMTVEEYLQHTHLKEEDIEELKQVGKNLEYTESLDLYIEQIEYKIKNLREVYQSKRKLCQSLGIMGGIFLVILLL